MLEDEILDYPMQDENLLVYQPVNSWDRLASMIMDYAVTMALICTFWVLFSLISEAEFIQIIIIVLFLPMFLYKDIINGMSFSKRFLGIQVIDTKTGNPATPIQTIIRNFTFILLPVEILFVIFNPRQRIGDYIAKTQLVSVKQTHAQSLLEEAQVIGFKISYLWAYLLSLAWMGFVYFLAAA